METPISIRAGLRAALATCGLFALAGCSSSSAEDLQAARIEGRLLLEQYDCGRCHIISGVRRAQGVMGPVLHGFSQQAYIAGEIPNIEPLLVQWIQSPHQLVPDTLMPSQDVPEAHARRMAAYLMSLR